MAYLPAVLFALLTALSCTLSFAQDEIPPDCLGNVSPLDESRCCSEFGVGCRPPFECSTTGSFGPPIPCRNGQTCVIFDHGFIAADGPSEGTCENLDDQPPKCSVEVCSKTGQDTLCTTRDGLSNTVVSTCKAFATRVDGGPTADCDFVCTQECLIPPSRLLGSDGVRYCNLCLLQGASCRSNFRIFGPVEEPRDKCEGDISPLDAAQCCTERGIGCLGAGQTCSTAAQVPPVPCKQGLTCVIFDFGEIARDKPNRGVCKKLRRMPKICSIARCSRRGPKYVCRVPPPRGRPLISTCKAWAQNSDGFPRPRCRFACPELCAVGKKKPLASNGKRFCSRCILKRKSCETDFMVYGPVRA